MPLTVFRPCIDLHEGVVKQIVGGSLSERDPFALQTNFISRFVSVELRPLTPLRIDFEQVIHLQHWHVCIKNMA